MVALQIRPPLKCWGRLAAPRGDSVAAFAATVPPPGRRSLCLASRRCGGRAAILGTQRYARRPRPADAAAGRGLHRLWALTAAAAPAWRRWRRPLGPKACAPAAGLRCAPPVPACCRRSRPAAGASSVVSRPGPVFSCGGASAQPPSPPPPVPASDCAGKQGGGACSGRWPRRLRGTRRALPLQPRPPFWPRGGAYFIFAAAGLGIAPPAGGAKVLPSCTRCAIGCGVHGFAMNLLRIVTSINHALLS